jgi:hypothetical protein
MPYLQRLLKDEYVQEQLREAALGLRNAYARAASKGVQATDDRRLYASLRRAATSVRNVGLALRKPEPPPKRRGRKLLIIAVAASGAALLTRLGREPQPPSASSDIGLATHADRVERGSVQPETVPTHS